ncbi:MAG TPA: lipid-A-disaccharide synthase [Gammaproteobacteria bacterium]|nr:lipid-A-disaccharide synthase [Gammaproteobacteria bacterium]
MNDAARRYRIALVAGERSGDTLGAGLIAALRRRVPDAEFFGIAGEQMVAAGCTAWFPAEELAVMGLAEVLHHLPRLLKIRAELLRRLERDPPDVFVGIDSPDFNLPVEARFKRSGLCTIQYVSPQIWAWRQSRVATMRAAADLVLCLLPFEVAFYEAHGVNARFVGHPLADAIPLDVDREAARAALGLSGDTPLVALLPGSRRGEVGRLAEPFVEAAAWLQRRRPGTRVAVALANARVAEVFERKARAERLDPAPALISGRARDVVAAADAVLTASGTATLETLLLKRPMVVAYRFSSLTYAVVRRMGVDRLPHFSLPNLLAGRRVVPELRQGDVRADVLGPALESVLDGEGLGEGWYDAFHSIHRDLRRGADDAAAAAVLELLEAKR